MWYRALRDNAIQLCFALFFCVSSSLVSFAAIKLFFVEFKLASIFNLIIDIWLIGIFVIFLCFTLSVFLIVKRQLGETFYWLVLIHRLKKYFVVVDVDRADDGAKCYYNYFNFGKALIISPDGLLNHKVNLANLLDDIGSDFGILHRESMGHHEIKYLFKSEEDAVMFKLMS
jgi:hypothetical protein